jgi:hypothetical protein
VQHRGGPGRGNCLAKRANRVDISGGQRRAAWLYAASSSDGASNRLLGSLSDGGDVVTRGGRRQGCGLAARARMPVLRLPPRLPHPQYVQGHSTIGGGGELEIGEARRPDWECWMRAGRGATRTAFHWGACQFRQKCSILFGRNASPHARAPSRATSQRDVKSALRSAMTLFRTFLGLSPCFRRGPSSTFSSLAYHNA